MSGIVFMKTCIQDQLREFYTNKVGCELWLDQGGCCLFRHGNFITGFCAADRAETSGMLTFFYETAADVDAMYEIMKDCADGPPRENSRYRIYQFFAKDPEGRALEFQYFLHPVNQHRTADEVLRQRRSVREYMTQPVPKSLLHKILDTCSFAPTSMNTQAVYYKIITDPGLLDWLSQVRGAASSPLKKAPLAVAICADSSQTKRPEQDSTIAAYHLMIAARNFGLGTCWIAAMDRDDVKQTLGIAREMTIATITPLGWPSKVIETLPCRRSVSDMLL